MVTYVFPFAIDDAYISLRYAENWANGYGPVFNPGERVEGYTNFLLVAVEMLLFKLGLEGLLPVKIFSILCGIALLGIVEHFTWKRHRSIFLATCAGLLVGTSSPLGLLDGRGSGDDPIYLTGNQRISVSPVQCTRPIFIESCPDHVFLAGTMHGLLGWTIKRCVFFRSSG